MAQRCQELRKKENTGSYHSEEKKEQTELKDFESEKKINLASGVKENDKI